MALLIAHRGLLDGADTNLENHPNTLLLARSLGYDVELDIRYLNDKWWLGHDEPIYEIDLDWLRSLDRNNYLDQHHAWIHAKDINTLYQLRKIRWEGHVFAHSNDPVVLTSTGWLWTYPGEQLTPLSICVMPEWTDAINKVAELKVHGFCTDHVLRVAGSIG